MQTNNLQISLLVASIKAVFIFVIGSISVAAILQLIHWFAYCKDIYACKIILQGFDFCLGSTSAYIREHITIADISLLFKIYSVMVC